MPCKACEAAKNYLHLARSTLKPRSSFPFLYETHTIQRRLLSSSSCRTAEQSHPSAKEQHIPDARVNSPPKSDRVFRPIAQSLRAAAEPHGIKHFRPLRHPRNLNDSSQRPPDSAFVPQSLQETRHKPKDERRNRGRLQTPNVSLPGKEVAFKQVKAADEAGDELDVESSSPLARASTITDLERDAFARLFGSLSSKPTPPSPSEDPDEFSDSSHSSPARSSLLADLDDELTHHSRVDRDIEAILDRELAASTPHIDRYPTALRPMATRAQMQLTRDKLVQKRLDREAGDRGRDEVAVRADREITQLQRRMMACATDGELWDVLEDEVFAQVRGLDLGALEAGAEGAAAATRDDAATLDKHDVAVLSRVYPAALLLAMRLLNSRTTYTPLVASILPACKALGVTSYVMGASTALYNELLSHTWRISSDLRGMLTLLQEMEDAGLEMDMRTWWVLEQTTLYRYRALRGDFGEGARVVEGMSERMREGKQIWGRKREIRKGLEDAQLKVAREGDGEEWWRMGEGHGEGEDAEGFDSGLMMARNPPVAVAGG